MKIGETRPAAAAPAVRREERAARSYAQARAHATPPPQDSASVLGIPEAELTPKVRAAIMTLMQEVDTLRQELSTAQSRLAQAEQLADQDPLTPVMNRRAFVRELTRIISYGQRYGTSNSVVYFDINDFKQVNDSYGHAAGDAALLSVAETLTAQVRESDVVGRLGGDEFGVTLVNIDESAAQEKAAALAAAIGAVNITHGAHRFAVSVSYGVSTFTGMDSADAAVAAADRAMYAKKREQESR